MKTGLSDTENCNILHSAILTPLAQRPPKIADVT